MKTDVFLQQVVDTVRRIKAPNFEMMVADLHGFILAATPGLNKYHKQIIGFSFTTITREQVAAYAQEFGIDPSHIPAIVANCHTLGRLVEICALEHIAISYLDFSPYGGYLEPYLGTMIPIFGETDAVVGVQIVTTDYCLYGKNEYFANIRQLAHSNERMQSKNVQVANLKFSKRQLEIIYLLCQGLSQSEAAQIMHISRGTIANIVSEKICPKFNLPGSFTKLLVEKAKQLGLDKYMPPTLFKPFLIVLNEEIVERYFQG